MMIHTLKMTTQGIMLQDLQVCVTTAVVEDSITTEMIQITAVDVAPEIAVDIEKDMKSPEDITNTDIDGILIPLVVLAQFGYVSL